MNRTFSLRRMLAAFLLAVAMVAAPQTAGGAAAATPAPVTISGVDLHDVTIRKFGGTYYMYGSMYACGFEWYVPNTPWCGFGVSTAPSLTGPWTAPMLLFSPTSQDPWAKRSWQVTCGGTGQGCFNPRMIQRSGWGADDGVFILWFNAPRHYSDTYANAYNVMGCASPSGPCGPGVTPHGSYNKPTLPVCGGNGDFGIIDSGTPGGRPAIVCTQPSAAELRIEELNTWGSGGTGTGVREVAGLTHVEGPGGWWDPEQQRYVLTYSEPGCGYCAGTGIGYATAPSLYAGWAAPTNPGFGQPANGRRMFNANSCGGQPRTVTVLDGQPWQIIDLWLGTRNEAAADTHLVPLDYEQRSTGQIGDVWVPPLSLNC